jgi:hypothetical protein
VQDDIGRIVLQRPGERERADFGGHPRALVRAIDEVLERRSRAPSY